MKARGLNKTQIIYHGGAIIMIIVLTKTENSAKNVDNANNNVATRPYGLPQETPLEPLDDDASETISVYLNST